MRIIHVLITVGAIALSLTTMTGMVHSKQFQEATAAETSGFDALAHDVFAHGFLSGSASKAAPGAQGE